MGWTMDDFKNAVDSALLAEEQKKHAAVRQEQIDFELQIARLNSLKDQIIEDHGMLLHLYQNSFENKFPNLGYGGDNKDFICDGFYHQMGLFPDGGYGYKYYNMDIGGKFGFDDSGEGKNPCLVFDNETLFVVNCEGNHLRYAPTTQQIKKFCDKFEKFHIRFIEWMDKNLSQYRNNETAKPDIIQDSVNVNLTKTEVLTIANKNKLGGKDVDSLKAYYGQQVVNEMIKDGFSKERIAIIGKDFNASDILKQPDVNNLYKSVHSAGKAQQKGR